MKELRGLEERLKKGEPGMVGAFLDIARRPDSLVRDQSIEILMAYGPPAQEIVPDLVKLLRDPEERLRSTAARTLTTIDPSTAVRELLVLMRDADPAVRARAALNLANNGSSGCSGAAAADLGQHFLVLNERMITDAVPLLVSVLQTDGSAAVRKEAARALGNFGCRNEAVKVILLAALEDSDSEVRVQAAWSLNHSGILSREETDALVARNAPLGEVSTSDLIRRLPAPHDTFDREVVNALARRGMKAVPELCAALSAAETWGMHEGIRQTLEQLETSHDREAAWAGSEACLRIVNKEDRRWEEQYYRTLRH